MEVNTQPREGSSRYTQGHLEVVKVWETMQGEGPFAGVPAVFVRLAGCYLQCPLCDTDYTSKRDLFHPTILAQQIAAYQKTLVVLTGGEPLRQNLKPLVAEVLREGGVQIQIETNGTYFDPYLPWQYVVTVCSPKTAGVHQDIAKHIDIWKYVVEAGYTHPDDGLPTRVLGKEMFVARPPNALLGHKFAKRNAVLIQPLDEQDQAKNLANTQEAYRVCQKFGYRLSLQQHKLLGIE